MTDRDQFIVEMLAQTTANIQDADRKASMLLTGQFAFLGLFANVVAPIWSDGGRIFHYLTSFTTLAALVSVLAAAVVIFPREGTGDLMYFAETAQRDQENYIREVMELDAEGRSKELLRSDHSLSAIANRKHSYVRLSVGAAVLAVCFGVAAITSFGPCLDARILAVNGVYSLRAVSREGNEIPRRREITHEPPSFARNERSEWGTHPNTSQMICVVVGREPLNPSKFGV